MPAHVASPREIYCDEPYPPSFQNDRRGLANSLGDLPHEATKAMKSMIQRAVAQSRSGARSGSGSQARTHSRAADGCGDGQLEPGQSYRDRRRHRSAFYDFSHTPRHNGRGRRPGRRRRRPTHEPMRIPAYLSVGAALACGSAPNVVRTSARVQQRQESPTLHVKSLELNLMMRRS